MMFQKRIRSSLINNYIKLIVEAHNEIKNENKPLLEVNEDIRKNQLVSKMKEIKRKFNISGPIVTENSYVDNNFVTNAFADITYYPSLFDDKGLIIECKIVKKRITENAFKKIFYDEGIDRFKDKYPVELDFAGFISFCENDTVHDNVKEIVETLMETKYENLSQKYNKQFIYSYNYLNIKDLFVFLLNYDPSPSQ